MKGKLLRYRCHAYTTSALLSEVTKSVESLLYQSLRGLEETTTLLPFGQYCTDDQQGARLFFRKADAAGPPDRIVHNSICQHEALRGDLPFEHQKLA